MSEKLFNVGIKAIITKDKKLLMVHNSQGYWEVPGGRMDGNETIGETLKRELKEEIPNIRNISIGGIIGASRVHKDIKDNVSLVLLFYKVSADFDGEPKLSDEHQDYKWVTKDEASEIAFDEYRKVIAELQV